jgi:hypothetical protein
MEQFVQATLTGPLQITWTLTEPRNPDRTQTRKRIHAVFAEHGLRAHPNAHGSSVTGRGGVQSGRIQRSSRKATTPAPIVAKRFLAR